MLNSLIHYFVNVLSKLATLMEVNQGKIFIGQCEKKGIDDIPYKLAIPTVHVIKGHIFIKITKIIIFKLCIFLFTIYSK